MENLFAIRLSEFIKETGLSKRKFAEKAGIMIFFGDAIALMFADKLDWTAGKLQPNAESIYLICKSFSVSADYLLGLENKI